MQELHMSMEDIQKRMIFSTRTGWKNPISTNCYAYALGLDIPEEEIIERAYVPGTIGASIFSISPKELCQMSLDERVACDLQALHISFQDCDSLENSTYFFEGDYLIFQWIIAMYTGQDYDFHFMKKSWNHPTWWHKQGYGLGKPINYDDEYHVIHDPKTCKLDGGYQFVKCMKLSAKTDWHTFTEKD